MFRNPPSALEIKKIAIAIHQTVVNINSIQNLPLTSEREIIYYFFYICKAANRRHVQHKSFFERAGYNTAIENTSPYLKVDFFPPVKVHQINLNSSETKPNKKTFIYVRLLFKGVEIASSKQINAWTIKGYLKEIKSASEQELLLKKKEPEASNEVTPANLKRNIQTGLNPSFFKKPKINHEDNHLFQQVNHNHSPHVCPSQQNNHPQDPRNQAVEPLPQQPSPQIVKPERGTNFLEWCMQSNQQQINDYYKNQSTFFHDRNTKNELLDQSQNQLIKYNK